MLPPSLQDSLPAGWLAFAGRASTLWIAAKGFRSSILLFWTWPGAREVSYEPPFTSFDHLVGARQQCRRHGETERSRRDQVDDQIKLGRLLDRKVGRLCPAQNRRSRRNAGTGPRSSVHRKSNPRFRAPLDCQLLSGV